MKAIVQFVLMPSNAMVVLACIALALLWFGRWRLARRCLTLSVGIALIFGYTSAPELLQAPLESRFPPLDPKTAPAPDGIMVLGGHLIEVHAAKKGTEIELVDGAESIITGALLALRHPEARIIVSGGHGSGFPPAPMREADGMQRVMIALGVAPERIEIEPDAATTAERVENTLAMIGDDREGTWWAITGAADMPRMIGTYRSAGFDPVPVPVDHRWVAPFDPLWTYRLTDGLAMADGAVHEWLGLAYYRATGRIDRLFPAPTPKSTPDG